MLTFLKWNKQNQAFLEQFFPFSGENRKGNAEIKSNFLMFDMTKYGAIWKLIRIFLVLLK